MSEIDEPTQVSRRDMLRKTAIVGGHLAWTVPAVQAIGPMAFAQGSPGTPPGECENFYVLKIDVDPDTGEVGEIDDNPGAGGFECLNTAGAIAGGQAFLISVVVANGEVTVTLDGATQQQSGFSKCGRDGCEPASSIVNAGQDVVMFIPCQGSGPGGQDQDISHVEIRFCV